MSRLQAVLAFVATVPNGSPKTRGRVCAVDKAKTLCVPGVPTFFRYSPSIQRFSSCGTPTPPRAQRRSSYGQEVPLKVGDTGDREALDTMTRMNKPNFRRHLSLTKREHAGDTLLALGDTKDRDSRRQFMIGSDRIPFVTPRALEGEILEETAKRVRAGGFTL